MSVNQPLFPGALCLSFNFLHEFHEDFKIRKYLICPPPESLESNGLLFIRKSCCFLVVNL